GPHREYPLPPIHEHSVCERIVVSDDARWHAAIAPELVLTAKHHSDQRHRRIVRVDLTAVDPRLHPRQHRLQDAAGPELKFLAAVIDIDIVARVFRFLTRELFHHYPCHLIHFQRLETHLS